MTTGIRWAATAVVALTAWAGSAFGQTADTVRLYDDLGDHHHAISTTVPLTQRYFDQGFRFAYAFNHVEAIRSFREAARLDPSCAICWWGVAYAYGPNINLPMDSASGVEAYRAVQRAVSLEAASSERERAYIDAMVVRYVAPSAAPARTALDSAYARAMAGVAERYPDDDDAQVLHAEAMMLLRPWDYWTRDGAPREGTEELLGVLESVIRRSPNHPGACHYYIHAVEAAHPDRAVACAERLAGLMPGAGHIVHMPAHIYVRVGRYADAVQANEHAVHVDEDFLADRGPTGIYTSGYYPHDYHFLAFAAMMAGMSEEALHAARRLTETIDPAMITEVYFFEQMPAYLQLARTTFGRWDEILADERPDPAWEVASGMDAYARGVALAATGRCDAAAAELATVQAASAGRAAGTEGPAQAILPIADHALQGEIALRCGTAADAVLHFQAAVTLEDELLYDEPPLFYYPVRLSLGRALLDNGRAAEAEAAYRADLARFPANGWALYGLASALEAQGRTAEASEARARFDEAWKGADVTLPASRF